MERAIFSPEGRRGKSETMIQYVARKRTLLQELTRVKCDLPPQALGYILLRDAGLNERAWDTVETWTKGSYDVGEIATALRRLERPVPGRTGSHVAGMTGFELGSPACAPTPPSAPTLFESPQQQSPQISQCLFIHLEQFEDEVLLEALNHVDDPNIFYLSGDIPDDAEFTEEETTAIMANYNQVRKYLHTKKLGRGFFKGNGKGKGGPKGGGKWG